MGFSCRFSFTWNPLSVNFHEVGMGDCQSPLKFTSPHLSRELAANISRVPRVKVCRAVVTAREKVIGVGVMTEAVVYWSCPANWELPNCYWTNLVMSTGQQNGERAVSCMAIDEPACLFVQPLSCSNRLSTSLLPFIQYQNWIRILASKTWSISEKNCLFLWSKMLLRTILRDYDEQFTILHH